MEQFLRELIHKVRTFFRQRLHYQAEDLPYYLTILAAVIVFVVGLNAFVELTEELAENQLTSFDNAVTEYVISLRSDNLTSFMVFLTKIGTQAGYFIIVALLAIYFFFRHQSWKFIVQTVAVLLLASLCNVALKQFINRARPSIEHLVDVYSLSYPSGHAMSAMSFYGFIIFLTFRYEVNRRIRLAIFVLLGLLIAGIGISRIYLGVHYPSDVLAGFIGGLIWVTFCAIVFDIADLNRKRKNRRIQLQEVQKSKLN